MKIYYNYPALTNFDRFVFADTCRNSGEAPIAWERCQCEIKPIPARIPLTLTIKPLSTYWGFFVRAVIATIDKAPEWVSCNVNTGWYMPLGARLANLVEVSRNLYSQSGKMAASWNELTRHAHLVWKQMEQVVKSFYLLLPL